MVVAVCGGFRCNQRKPPQTAPTCPRVAPIGAGRWRQSALGGGANRRWAVAPIGAGRINTYIKTTTPLRIVPTHPHRKIPRNGRQWPFLA
eukprot:COSAG03_NODE_1275_length_4419_cov_16.726620_1_plen_89_part_10